MYRFLPSTTTVIGYARSDYTDESLRGKLRPTLGVDDTAKDRFLSTVTYVRGSYDTPDGFKELSRALCEKEAKYKGHAVARLF